MSQCYTFFYYARKPVQTCLHQEVLTIQLSYSMHKFEPRLTHFSIFSVKSWLHGSILGQHFNLILTEKVRENTTL